MQTKIKYEIQCCLKSLIKSGQNVGQLWKKWTFFSLFLKMVVIHKKHKNPVFVYAGWLNKKIDISSEKVGCADILWGSTALMRYNLNHIKIPASGSEIW